MKMLTTIVVFAYAMGLSMAAYASPLDDALADLKKDRSAADEASVHRILRLGQKEKREAEVFASIQSWLKSNPLQDPNAVYLAATSAELAGEWVDAVSFYRQLLSAERINNDLAHKAVPRLYRLMITGLRDHQGVYLYMRKHGERLWQYGNARQFDPWFLQQAFEKRDLVAVAERLALIHNRGDAAAIEKERRQLLNTYESFKYDSDELRDAMKTLVDARQTSPEIKARIRWVAEIMPVNAKVDELFRARKEIPKSLFTDAARAAAALIALQPYDGSVLVARGWCDYGDSHTPNRQAKAKMHREIKSKPLFDAMLTFTPAQLRSFLAIQGGSRNSCSVIWLFTPAQMRALVLAQPQIFSSLTAPNVPLVSKEMKTAQAGKLAPILARNPHFDAALVRGFAAAGGNFTDVAAAIYKDEMWRFSEDKRKRAELARRIWDSGLKQDGDYKEVEAGFQQLSARTKLLSRQCSKKADPEKRLAAFETLLEDLLRESPSIPAALPLFNQLPNMGSPDEKVARLKLMTTGDLSEARRELLHQVMNRTEFGNPYGRITPTPSYYEAYWRWGRKHVLKQCTELADHAQGLLRAQMKKGSLDRTILLMWLRTVETKKPEAIAFIKALVGSKAWNSLPPAYREAAKDRFFKGVFKEEKKEIQPDDPRYLSRELLSLPKEATAAQAHAALKAVLDRLPKEPGFPGIYGLARVPHDRQAYQQYLHQIFVQYAPLRHRHEQKGYLNLARYEVDQSRRAKEYQAIPPLARSFWLVAHSLDDRTLGNSLVGLAGDALAADRISTVVTLAKVGLFFNAPNSRHHHERENRVELRQLYGKVSEAMGVAEIPVQPNEPGYKIFKSQAEFVLNNQDTAWALYDASAEEIDVVIRKLRHDYCFWLLSRNVAEGNVARVENLVKLLTLWDRRGDAGFTLQQQAELKLAYADVAFQKGAYAAARSWYRRVADSQEYRGSDQQYRAILGSVAVDRENKNYAGALTELERMMLVKDKEWRMRVHYAKAQIYFSQTKYAEANSEIDAVLRYDPKHADAKLLQSKIYIEKRDLIPATKVRIGPKRSKEAISPGERVEVELNDPALNVSGAGAAIEVEVRAASGDVERAILRPIGESNTEYRAEVPTELGPPRPNDDVLQVLGRDTITYGFSKRFRAKMDDLPDDPDERIEIASDFHLAISAGAFPPREGERTLSLSELGVSTAEKALGFGRVRPGNPIYVRVIDPDQSKTPEKDQVTVEIKSTSGDIIKQFVLQETGPFSGEFEGAVPTASGQAAAYASTSQPGSDPNMAISPKDYPGWIAQAASRKKERFFTVDLNDNVDLKSMTIESPEDQALTYFVVQTSLNGKTWTSRASLPGDRIVPWDGHPQFEGLATYSKDGQHIGISELTSPELPDDWRQALQRGSADPKISYVSGKAGNLRGLKIPEVGRRHPAYGTLVRFRALFYQPETAMRRFVLKGFKDQKKNTIFLIDGKPGSADDPFDIDREFKPGLHEIEVWRNASYREMKVIKGSILCDLDGKTLSPCPDDMFDPSSFPPAIREALPRASSIRMTETGRAEVIFGKNIKAQLIRLLIGKYQGGAPAIKKITLTDTDGKRHLPVETDYQELRRNKQMEVLPGDRVNVKYVDDLAFTEDRTQQEKSLTVAFNTATIAASFINYEQDRDGSRKLKFEDIRRFRMDDNVGFIIDDPDMDVSPKRDAVSFRVRTSDGNTKTYKAYETEAHSGVFLGKVFPITGEPQRESEIQMEEGGTLTAVYRDMENLDPGIPADREVMVEHAKYVTPRFNAYTASTSVLSNPVEDAPQKSKKQNTDGRRTVVEVVRPRLALTSRRLTREETQATTPPKAVYNSSIRFDVLAPHLALAKSSVIHAYVQTESGRRLAARRRQAAAAEGKSLPPLRKPFDLTVPGTLKLTATPGSAESLVPPLGYRSGSAKQRAGRNHPNRRSSSLRRSPLDVGRFSFQVKLGLGEVPLRSFATDAAENLPADVLPEQLNVSPGDRVYVAYAYLDKAGKPHWHTTAYDLIGDVLLDVMDKEYSESIQSRFVGEKIFVRVIAPELDTSAERDVVTVQLAAESGAYTPFSMRETFEHSGIFKGNFKLDYAETPRKMQVDAKKFFLYGLPVRYSDTVQITRDEAVPSGYSVKINNGSDGGIEPFSKRYSDSSTAIKTNFTLAECWFELAKMHRVMGKDDSVDGERLTSLSRREMKHAKKLLNEALATHRDPEQQAHAEYLLGNLAQEYADVAVNKEIKEQGYHEALSRFARIPVDYPKSLFAPQAQYKKALVYEKMKQMEIAVEEYVKLAYKYPDDELIPMAMSRIGGHFQTEGIAGKKLSDLKKAQADEASREEAVKLLEAANKNFSRAATIYRQLQKEYPEHPLAGFAGLRAAQNRMRIGDYRHAIPIFEEVYENENYDGPDVRAQALYWAGICYEKSVTRKGGEMRKAFRLYNRTRFEFSNSKWAKYARGRLASEAFAKLVEEEEKRREMALEAMKSN